MASWIKMAGCGCIAALAAVTGLDWAGTRPGPHQVAEAAAPARVASHTPALPRRARLVRIPDRRDPEPASDSASALKRPYVSAIGDVALSLGLLLVLMAMTRRRPAPAAVRG